MRESVKTRYEYKWYSALENVCVFPLMLASFPIPLLLPILLIGMAIEKPQNVPIAIIYFLWLIIGCSIVFYFENRDQKAKKK